MGSPSQVGQLRLWGRSGCPSGGICIKADTCLVLQPFKIFSLRQWIVNGICTEAQCLKQVQQGRLWIWVGLRAWASLALPYGLVPGGQGSWRALGKLEPLPILSSPYPLPPACVWESQLGVCPEDPALGPRATTCPQSRGRRPPAGQPQQPLAAARPQHRGKSASHFSLRPCRGGVSAISVTGLFSGAERAHCAAESPKKTSRAIPGSSLCRAEVEHLPCHREAPVRGGVRTAPGMTQELCRTYGGEGCC